MLYSLLWSPIKNVSMEMLLYVLQIDRFVSVSKLKYYFAVDTTYVVKKLGLLVFPFTHKVCTKNLFILWSE